MFTFLVPFSLVLSFRLTVCRLFLLSSPSLFVSLPCFPWWRILLFCYLVSALHPHPRTPCEPEVCVFSLRAVFFLAFLMLTYFVFLLFLPFFNSICISLVSSWVFFLWVIYICCLLGFGFCCESFSMYLETYVR